MKVPIACTLSVENASDRVGEWRAALTAVVTRVARPSPTRAELQLDASPAQVADLVDLAQREKTCCELFTFAFEVGSHGVVFVVTVPDDAVAVLDDLADLAVSNPSGQVSAP